MNNENNKKYIYANQLGIGFGKYDMFIDVSNATNKEDIIDNMRINMSLPFAKILANALNKSIEEYENKYGEIKEFKNEK